MADLIAQNPTKGRLPTTIGALRLAEMRLTQITGLSPHAGEVAQTSTALRNAHGLDLPAPNRMAFDGDTTILWTGRNRWLLIGPPPDHSLRAHAALSDQSDAWVGITLTGPAGPDVLARLTPLDLRAPNFAPGMALRSELFHMQTVFARPAPDQIIVMTFRSMAGTLIHDLTTAARAIHARAQNQSTP